MTTNNDKRQTTNNSRNYTIVLQLPGKHAPNIHTFTQIVTIETCYWNMCPHPLVYNAKQCVQYIKCTTNHVRMNHYERCVAHQFGTEYPCIQPHIDKWSRLFHRYMWHRFGKASLSIRWYLVQHNDIYYILSTLVCLKQTRNCLGHPHT